VSETPWQVVTMTAADLAAVELIECQSPTPWSARQLAEELACPGALQLVCRSVTGGQPVGFIMARLLADEAEILKLATAHEFRRRGIASCLLNSFIAGARQRGVAFFHLELRAHNAPAQALYEKFAFEVTGRRRNYYTAPQDDALCMTLSATRTGCPGRVMPTNHGSNPQFPPGGMSF